MIAPATGRVAMTDQKTTPRLASDIGFPFMIIVANGVAGALISLN